MKINSKDIVIINKDSNFNYKIDGEIEITIYGTKSTLEKINSVGDINPYIDVKGFDRGSHSVPIEIKPLLNIGHDNQNIDVDIS